MKDNLIHQNSVPLADATLLLALSGWMDGGDVSTGTVRTLMQGRDLSAVARIAEIGRDAWKADFSAYSSFGPEFDTRPVSAVNRLLGKPAFPALSYGRSRQQMMAAPAEFALRRNHDPVDGM